MKRLIILFLAASSFAACTTQPDKIADSSDTASRPDEEVNDQIVKTMCFQKLAGTANHTTSIKLIVKGDQVSGDFGHYPKEKDRRVGKITAINDGKLIKGVWVYMQEGISDTLQIEFKLVGEKLVQKNYTVDAKTGREVFSEASVFNIEFDKVSCKD
jgi:hypothetical protein